MGDRMLLCVDGSVAALEAARVAVDLAARHGGVVRALFVVDARAAVATASALGEVSRGVDDVIDSPADRLSRTGEAVLERVAALGEDDGVEVETVLGRGEPLDVILEEAEEWGPDLVLIGRTGRRGPGSAMMGSTTAHVIEFAQWPVVVVPARAERHGHDRGVGS